jgi:hypothetical protein
MAARERDRRRRAHDRAQHREERRTRRRGRRKILKWTVGGFVGVVFTIIVISLIIPPNLDLSALGGGNATSEEAGGEVRIQGNFEIERGESHQPYNSFPPTSGWYYAIPTEDIVWGVRDEPVEEEEQVSYLVRGAVMVQYNCPDECPDLVRNLERVVDNYPEAVILAPYTNMSSTIALTAWGWQDAFEEDELSEARVNDFIQAHFGMGPEDFRLVQ